MFEQKVQTITGPPDLLSYFGSMGHTLHGISALKKTSLLTEQSKCTSNIKKICIYYVIESFKVSITFTGLKICLTQLWKLARQTQRSAKMNSALFAVIMPGCGLAVLTDQEAANVQARRQATVRTVHLSSLAGVQSSAASPQFHLWKCPSLSFSFKIWQKLPETAVLPINSEPGGRERNHQTHTHPKTNSNSSNFHGGKTEAGFSGQPYFP